MSVTFANDGGYLTELKSGTTVVRSPLVRINGSLYLFLVTQNAKPVLPPKSSSRPPRPPDLGERWEVSLAEEIDGRWSVLGARDGGAGAASGPHGVEVVVHKVFPEPTRRGPSRLRIRYGLSEDETVEEVLTVQAGE